MTPTSAAKSTRRTQDPHPDEYVLDPSRVGASGGVLSRYGDDAWHLGPMASKATVGSLTVDFMTFPAAYRSTVRRIVWTFIHRETPMDELGRTTAIRSRLSAGSIHAIMHDVRGFLQWLNERGIESLQHVSEAVLRDFGTYVSQRPVVRNVKARQLFTVTRIWLIAPYLPAQDQLRRPTWEAEDDPDYGIKALIGPSDWTGENKTPPIHPQSMSALLLAAMRFIDVFSPDILQASADRTAMREAIPERTFPEHHEKVAKYLDSLVATGRPLPGVRGRSNADIDCTRVATQFIAATLGVNLNALRGLPASGIAVRRGAPLPTLIKGEVEGRPWRGSIDYYDVGQLRSLLMTACFIVTAYLSGMRIEECRALRRGCCIAVRAGVGTPAHYEIRGHTFKDVVDIEGNTVPGGAEREHPWLVIEPVARAIGIAESLHTSEYLFDAAAFKRQRQDAGRPVNAQLTRKSIGTFIDYWNDYCADQGREHEAIPPDPDGDITPVRFRRTLAWFIYRVPGGRIAVGLQYGHLRGQTSDGYGSRAASGLRDVFPMESALAVAETLHAAGQRLDAGEQVSGPAASRFAAGVRTFQRTFEGAYLTSRQMAALLRNPELRIYDNPDRALACVYDQSKALCHPDRSRPADDTRSPDMSRCRDGCANTARTDTHAQILRDEVERLEFEINDPLTPEPIKARLAARVERRRAEIETHQATRLASANEPEEPRRHG